MVDCQLLVVDNQGLTIGSQLFTIEWKVKLANYLYKI